jgi:cytochrome c oxidase cbb3-type subunit 1
VVSASLLIFHYLVLVLNFRVAFQSNGTAIRFIRFGLISYMLAGLAELLTSFRGVALHTQFTFFSTAIEQLGLYGGISMMFFGAIYYLVPRVTGNAWASSGLLAGHRILMVLGVVLSVVTLAYAGLVQGSGLLDDKATFATIFGNVRMTLLVNSAAQLILVTGNLLLLVNLIRTAYPFTNERPVATIFRQPSKLEAHAS